LAQGARGPKRCLAFVVSAVTMAPGARTDGLEWMRLLEAGWNRPDPEDKDDDMEVGEFDDLEPPLEVSTESDASALLSAVKERLAAAGRSEQYHDFLTAISGAVVDSASALAIIKGHEDLKALFKQCFPPPVEAADVGASEPVDRRSPQARMTQLAHLVFANKIGKTDEETKMVSYLKRASVRPAFPRRLFVLRGPAGIGKTQWAMEKIRKDCDDQDSEQLVVRLSHVCSSDDFFVKYTGGAESQYLFDQSKTDANNLTNEARARLAMEIGLEPLFIDNTNMRHWEMRPYIQLAERMGYVVTVVSPQEINSQWHDIDHLLLRNADKKRQNTEKHIGRPVLEAMLQSFERIAGDDPRPAIKNSKRPAQPEGSSDSMNAVLLPSAILYKLETLLTEGKNVLRYTPPDGKGWGVNGELHGEWHSFRERGDGSCTYDECLTWEWRTEDPESGWTFVELTWLEDLRQQAQELPKADLPNATTHPFLFAGKTKSSGAKTSKVAKASTQTKKPQPAAQALATPVLVPMSRLERFKARQSQLREDTQAEPVPAAPAPPAKVAKKAVKSFPAPAPTEERDEFEEEDDDEELEAESQGPTEQEEMSAATFLAAVKSRLTEWGKLEQYHEFVLAVSGSVDTKKVVRILRGHDDLLMVFRRKFAPSCDLAAIMGEVQNEEEPHPPISAPTWRGVKEELASRSVAPMTTNRPGRVLPAQPTPPSGPSPRSGVKRELVKSEFVKSEIVKTNADDMPRPPPYKPNSNKGPVTIGDDSDGEFADEASIAAAVKKGRNACIAELAKIVFRKERAGHEGARERLSMVHYATRAAARPRFPRELFILRGAPGTGKTDYAMQQLRDYADYEPHEELAARLTHVCAMDDFFEEFKGVGAEYKFEAQKVESYNTKNETRVRLAMEAGIHPIYVDSTNLRLWEMQGYIALADRLGYVTTVVEPHDICEKCDDVDFLVASNDTLERQTAGKVVPRGMLTSLVKAFEAIPDAEDSLATIRAAVRGPGSRVLEAAPEPPPAEAPRPTRTGAQQQIAAARQTKGVQPLAQKWTPQPGWANVKTEGQSADASKRAYSQPADWRAQKVPRYIAPPQPVRGKGKGW